MIFYLIFIFKILFWNFWKFPNGNQVFLRELCLTTLILIICCLCYFQWTLPPYQYFTIPPFTLILSTSLIMIYSYYILSIHLRKNDNYRLYLVANFLNRFLFSISRNWLCSNWCFLLMVIYYHAKAYLSIYFL